MNYTFQVYLLSSETQAEAAEKLRIVNDQLRQQNQEIALQARKVDEARKKYLSGRDYKDLTEVEEEELEALTMGVSTSFQSHISANAGLNVIKIEGVTVHENPFPMWFRDAVSPMVSPPWHVRVWRFLMWDKSAPKSPMPMDLDPINWSYGVQGTEHKCEAMQQWLCRLVQWAHETIGDEETKSVLRRMRSYTFQDLTDIPAREDVA